jgi:SAM-dependent methyltransferase
MHALLRNCLARARSVLGSGKDHAEADYARRLENETRFFADYLDVHDLPPIFHYWSNRHLAPQKFHPFGFNDAEQLYFLECLSVHRKTGGRFLNIVSLGSGNCDMEVRLARRLVDEGLENFRIECLDINSAMLERGMTLAREQSVADHFATRRADFNSWRADKPCDVVIASQCLHHVLELEHLFAAIRDCLTDEGCLLTSDMIGRNGHQRWPEALELVQEFWRELPDGYRYNRLLSRHEPAYINHDCSTEGFEGIRAQDILPLLIENFHFELFLPFANIVTVFIDRPFGHNFNAEGEWDRDFIDRVHARDEEAMLSGLIKPTQMMAVLKKGAEATRLAHPVLTPQFCMRPV